MTLLFFDGFESGPNPACKQDWMKTPVPGGAIQPPNIAVNQANARTGSGVLGGSFNNFLTIPASTTATVGVAFWHNTNAYPNYAVLAAYGDGSATPHITVTLNASRQLEVHRGPYNGVLLGTSTETIPLGAWRHLQLQVTAADSGGRVILKLDGVTQVDYTGDTRNGGTNPAITGFWFGGASSNLQNSSYDDLWVCDSVDATATQGRPNNDFLGDLKVQALLPTANGSTNTWTPSAGANYSCVDESPANTTDYISTSTVGNRDLFTMTDLAGAGTVYGIQANTYASKSDAGASAVKTVVQDSTSAVATDAAHPLSTNWQATTGPILATKPSGGVWSVADVNGAQVGVESA